MEDRHARRSAGRPRKHASGSARTAAWRTKHGLRKVTVEVPKNFVSEIRRLAHSFRKTAALLREQEKVRVYHVFFMTRAAGFAGETRFDQMTDEIITYLNFATPLGERRQPPYLIKWLYEHCLTPDEQTQFIQSVLT